MSIDKITERPNVLHLLRIGREVPKDRTTLYISPEFRAYADKNWQMVKPLMVPVPSGCLLDQLGYNIQVDPTLEPGVVYFVWTGSDGVTQRRGIHYITFQEHGYKDDQKA